MRKLGLAVTLLTLGFPAFLTAQQTTVKHGPAKETSPASGKEMFIAYCASCHGQSGKGDGPAAPAFKTPPTDLTMLATHSGGQFPTMMVMEAIKAGPKIPAHGSQEMPVWGPVFSAMSHTVIPQNEVQQRISNLTSYIKTLQAK